MWVAALITVSLVAPVIRVRAGAAEDDAQHRDKIVATVRGMGCPFCVYGLKQSLLMLPGVRDARVNLGRSQVIIDLAKGAGLTDDQVAKTIEQAGLSAGQIK